MMETFPGDDSPSGPRTDVFDPVAAISTGLPSLSTIQPGGTRPASIRYLTPGLGWSADYPHPQNFLSLFTCDSGNNDSGYCSQDYDNLVKKANADPDFESQIATYNQAQEVLVEDAPVIFIYWEKAFPAAARNLGGFWPSAFNYLMWNANEWYFSS